MNTDRYTPPRDDRGRWQLGNRRPCPDCGAAAIGTVAANGGAVWWHPPTTCCDGARRRVAGAPRT